VATGTTVEVVLREGEQMDEEDEEEENMGLDFI
jgi:hypothetical protein